MSYTSQAWLMVDQNFISRVASCAAIEVGIPEDPVAWANTNIPWIAAAPGFADAYESAVVGGVENPGQDPAVISDAMILGAVQAHIAALEALPGQEP